MTYQRIVTVDFETFYSSDYSLKLTKYNTSEYIRDPQFKVHCVAIKIDEGPVTVYSGDAIDDALDRIDWDTSALLAHNTAFDGFILSHHFGIVPAYYLDTLSMARAVHSNSIPANLNAVASFYGVGNKVPDVLDRTKGLRDLPPEILSQLSEYCAVDTELCYKIFEVMRAEFSDAEMDLIDLTIRMFCDPVLLVDIPRAEAALKKELDDRATTIERAGVPLKDLRSTNKFASALLALDVCPPQKTSPRTQKEAFAFAKGDLAFQELRTHPDERVRNLIEARIAAKSSIEETRAIRFIQAGSFGRPLPVGYKYFGAHTSRWSGSNGMNMQNLPRGGELRKAILAPPGMKIVACDSAQIEARVLAWLADHLELLELFRNGVDVYKHQAAAIYAIPIEEVTPQQRFVGKVCVLGLGYGMGAEKFQYTLAVGAMGPPVKLEDRECTKIVRAYRKKNSPIEALWTRMEDGLVRMAMPIVDTYKCITFHPDCVELPGGVLLRYPNFVGNQDKVTERYTSFTYCSLEDAVKRRMNKDIPIKEKKLYGGLLTENVVQALARIIVAEQMLEIAKKYRVVMMTHDEVVCVVNDSFVKDAEQDMLRIMSTPPAWCEDLPLNAEVTSGATYE